MSIMDRNSVNWLRLKQQILRSRYDEVVIWLFMQMKVLIQLLFASQISKIGLINHLSYNDYAQFTEDNDEWTCQGKSGKYLVLQRQRPRLPPLHQPCGRNGFSHDPHLIHITANSCHFHHIVKQFKAIFLSYFPYDMLQIFLLIEKWFIRLIMRRTVITGLGMVSPLGNSLEATWTAILEGRSGIQQYLNDPVLKNDKPFNLALVKDFQFNKWKVAHAPSRLNSFLAKATADAIASSKLDFKNVDRSRSGICLGSLASSTTKLLTQIEESAKDSYRTVNRLSMLQILANMPAATLNVQLQLKGPSLTVSTACASGLSAIIQGYKWVQLNEADVVVAGASQDIYNPLYLYSSLRLQAMSSKEYPDPSQASRPFDKARSGFILGQGSGVVIIESLEHALSRSAPIIAEIVGYGYTSDGFHLVRPESTGEGQVGAMRRALKMASIQAKDVDQVNVHATSTEAGDQIEARSIKQLLGEHASRPSITAFKSYFGHTFASAGAIETILGLTGMKQSIAPKILNLEEPDIEGLNYNRQNSKQEVKYMLKNSFGFGGINVSAVFKKY